MSALDLTPDEAAIVSDALRTKSNHYNAMFSSTDAALEALIAKVQSQLQPEPEPVVVVEPEPEIVADATEEAPAAE